MGAETLKVQKRALHLATTLINSTFVKRLVQFQWEDIHLKQIIIASIVINLLELAVPLYINIVYTVIIPARSTETLITLSTIVLLLVIGSGILKSVRISILGLDSARFEHKQRMNLFKHFLSIPISKFKKSSSSKSISQLNSINLLRDEGMLQFVSTTIDIIFSLIYIVILLILGGPLLVLPVILAIIYYIYSVYTRIREYKAISNKRESQEIENMNYQMNIVDSASLIKSNGLSRNFTSEEEALRENITNTKISEGIKLADFQSFGRLINQSTFALSITIGAFLIVNKMMVLGALTASILLVGKIINPWQQSVNLLRSFMRLDFARSDYDDIIQTDISILEGSKQIEKDLNSSDLKIQFRDKEINIKIRESNYITDQNEGQDVRELFMNLMRIESTQSTNINTTPVNEYNLQSIINNVAYVNPSHEFFEGTLIQNICNFQQSKYERTALYWAYYLNLDKKVRILNNGYDTIVGSSKKIGLTNDEIMLFHIIGGLAKKPNVLIIDLLDCSFGKYFVEGFKHILDKTKNNSTLIISGNGKVLEKLCTNKSLI